MNNKLTQERLKELLDYDSETGIFTWKVSTGSVKIGKSAGSLKPNGYIYIRIDGKPYYAHRLVILYVDGYFPEHDVDHINRNKVNNRYNNLRVVSRQCNIRNCGNKTNNTSGVKGINFFKQTNKWFARIMVNQKTYSLGYYTDFTEAVCARLAGEQCLDWSGCDSASPAFQYVQETLRGEK